MAENPTERHFKAVDQEKKFNEFYDNFFQVKVLHYLKNVKKKHYLCASSCITEEKIDEDCIKNCQLPHDNFFKHIESLLTKTLSSFHPCVDRCKKRQDSITCTQECTAQTLERFGQVDLQKEFSKYLSP